MKDQIKPTNPGTVVSVRGSVVDVRFDAQLPLIYSVLRAGDEQQIVIEALAGPRQHAKRVAINSAWNRPEQSTA